MFQIRRLLVLLLLTGVSLLQAQVLVYTGSLNTTVIGDHATAKSAIPIVMILNLAADRDPADFITLLTVEDGKSIMRCLNMSDRFKLFQGLGANGLHYTVVHFYELSTFDNTTEGDSFLAFGQNKTISLGKNAGTTVFAPSLSGPYTYYADTGNESENGLEQGTLQLRLQSKETQIANQPDGGGATPGYLVTVARQKEILANKYKLAAKNICVSND
jgi:hypothetical protein